MPRPRSSGSISDFSGWRGHDAELWERLREEALARRAARTPRRCIVGSDIDAEAVRMALANGAAPASRDWVHVEKRALASAVPPPRRRERDSS